MSPGPIRGTLRRFRFFRIFAQIFEKLYFQRCPRHRGKVPCRCPRHRGKVPCRCLGHRGGILFALKINGGVRDTAEKYPSGVRDTTEKYPTGVSDTAEKYPAGVSDTGDCFKIRISSRNFEKKNRNRLRMPQMGPEEAVLMKKSNFKNLVTLSL